MNFLNRLPIALQFSLLLLVVLALGGLSAYLIGDAVYLREAENQARTVADMVENVGTWASQYKGVWVRNDPAADKFKVGDFLEREAAWSRADKPPPSPIPALAVTNPFGADEAKPRPYAVEANPPRAAFHRKNPALVQRELSQVTQASPAGAKFRMTSDKFMNPNNAPNLFEMTAIDALQNSANTEYAEVRGDSLLYARKLVATSACLQCHGTPERAPPALLERYGSSNGFGYKEGGVAGVISVVIPLQYAPAKLLRDISAWTWVAIGAFLLSALCVMIYVQHFIISPVRALNFYAEKAAHSGLRMDIGRLQFAENEHDSGNEIHRLNAAIRAMYQSIRLMYKQRQ